MLRVLFCIIVLTSLERPAYSEQPVRVLDAKVYHLGTPGFPEWEEFAKSQAHGRRLDIQFKAGKNPTPQTLLIRQRQVKARWAVLLNNQRIGYLLNIDSKLVHSITVPPGKLNSGTNTLSIVAPKTTDDIEVGPITLNAKPEAEIFSASLNVSVTDKQTGQAMPSRITIVDTHGALAALRPAPDQRLAYRPGVVYTGGDPVSLRLLPGRYTIYASRGFEYSATKTTVTVRAEKPSNVQLTLAHEVPTPGLVATDTHIHTLTRSGHGDSTEHERMYTIAGEGIEFAVATDHNHHADYRPIQKSTGTSAYFTAVTGNEVTTKTGHFNAFPINPASPVPDAKLTDWTQLMKSIRATPGVRVVVLNHPRNTHSGFSPVAPENFNRITGRNLYGAPYSFDAIEVVTSAAMQSDYMAPYQDWFAMLNWGHAITGVGSSDTHDVSRFILGQARTYVECPDTKPDKINITKACESFRNMRAYISMGLLTHMQVDDRYRSGDIATNLNKEMKIHTRVLGPSWIRADRLELFANGHRILYRALPPTAKIEKANLTFTLPRPAHDTHLIAIATGPGITEPFWESPRPYVPTTPKHTPRVQGATNPIFIDGNGDGKYTSPRAQARQLLDQHTRDLTALFKALIQYDQAVAAQAAALLHQAGHDLNSLNLRRHWIRTPSIKTGFTAFLGTLGNVPPGSDK